MSEAQPQLALERIYTKDISFEVPGGTSFYQRMATRVEHQLVIFC